VQLARAKSRASSKPEQEAKELETADEGAIEAVISEFNAKYMVVNEAGKAVIYQPQRDPILGRKYFARISFEDFRRLYLNRTVVAGTDDKGNTIKKCVADVWLRHPERRQFIGGVCFDPVVDRTPPDALNLWEGFAVEPRKGDWSLLRDHLKNIICRRQEAIFDYLLGWLANMVQNPARQGEVAVVLKGGEGAGKGTLAKVVMKIVGQHGIAISQAKHLVGNFNSHLRDAIFLFADEAFFAGDKSHIGALKSLITEPYLTVEGKFQNAIQVPNFLHILMASNEQWVVPASMDARRFLVLNVADSVANDHEYFGKIWKQMESGGYEAMLHDLLAYDLCKLELRKVRVTTGLREEKLMSMATDYACCDAVLHRGYVWQSKLGLTDVFHKWMKSVSTELLYKSYLEFAKSRHERRPLSRAELGKFFHRLGATSWRPRGFVVVGEHITDVETANGFIRKAKPEDMERAPSYNVGDLWQARDRFTKLTGVEGNWPPEDD